MDTPPQSTTVADRVRERMDVTGQTEKSLANEAPIARTTLRRRLVDPSGFTISELTALAPALDTTLEYLLLGEAAAEKTGAA